MLLVIKLLYKNLKQFDEENADKRLDDLFLLDSPLLIASFSIFYLIFIYKLGPKFMKNRAAFNLKYVLMVYNLCQIMLNAILIYKGSKFLYTHVKFSELSCIRTERSASSYSTELLQMVHQYYLLKILDYLDTVFFVLRKSHKQITFLHVYHHFGMAIGGYVFVRYISGGQPALLGYLNAWVHMVMYIYYFMSALRPNMKTSLWWKKYITQLQIIQFVLNIIHFGAAFLRPDCLQPKMLMIVGIIQNSLMAVMFMDFYVKVYLTKKKNKS